MRTKPWVAALPVAMLMGSGAYAATLGHSRIVSEPGQALRMDVPIYELSADDLRSFTVSVAPAAAWTQAGLTPPVALSSLHVKVVHGTVAASRVIRFSSDQPFSGSVADLLLEVHTATGQQQYQVSVLATSPYSLAAGGAAGQSAAAGARTGGRQAQAGHRSHTSVHVRRGDTLFAIAQNHAVRGVSVYQMMVALQRANPQAFINQNMNLVKAGATLWVPDMASLTAVSDREARRIFQEQALAFAQYRQRLAGGKSAPLRTGSTNKGAVSRESAAPPPAAAAQPSDQVKLSSGGMSAADARADQRVATHKGIADTQKRVSQLEENVQHINQALQGQGEAAKDVVVGAAKGLGKSIADAAGVVAGATGNAVGSPNSPASVAAQAGGQGSSSGSAASNGQPSGGSAASSAAGVAPTRGAATENGVAGSSAAGSSVPGSSAAGNGTAGSSATGNSSSGSGNGSTGSSGSGNSGTGNSGTGNSGTGNSGTGNSGTGNSGTGNSGSGNSSAGSSSSGSSSSGSSATANNAAGNSTAGDNSARNSAAGGAVAGKTPGAVNPPADVGKQALNKAGQSVSWFQEHLLGSITALLALLVLVIAWLLRRANVARDDDSDDRASPITEAMVKEKLDQINLDLSQPPSDETPASKT
ncbi:type IV pilus assembly protein FimV [Paralcaligenes ureilyticus]|uniref:type IV pilus assembly protein FimV n=1 Tax=Paralcaligenes ureilyticus TaxID=627131 RepID=UPI001404C6D9|nr:FimV/HubP family polar landmark protein [Paralcaligenes ureilyticus]